MVQKKYIKLAAAGLAVVAIVIGVSVGVTQSNKNKASVSALASGSEFGFENIDDVCSSSSKSGKSGGSGGSKSSKGMSMSKSGKGMSMSKSSKSSLDDGTRRLVVPGTEDYVAEFGPGSRRALRNELLRGELIRRCAFGTCLQIA